MLPRSGFCSEGVDFLPLRESALTTSSPRHNSAGSGFLQPAPAAGYRPASWPLGGECTHYLCWTSDKTGREELSFPRSLSSSGADLTLTPQTSALPDSHDHYLTFQMLRFLAAPSHHALLTLPADLTAPAPSAQCPLFVPAPPPPDPAVLGAPLHGEPCWPHEG